MPLSSDEYMRQRRDRRMSRTGNMESEVRAWAEQRGCSLRVLNGGHHWLFQKSGFMAEWWPSPATLAVDRDYIHTHHCPHWTDVIAVLERRLAGSATQGTLFDASKAGVTQPSASHVGGNEFADWARA